MHVVLLEPEIPPNAGNVARLCAATRTRLHLVEPFGFKLNDRELKRAGMDPLNDIHWIRGNNPSNAAERLRAGVVDAIFQDPSDAKALSADGFSDVFDIAAHYPKGRPDRVNVATGKALQDKPEMVKACIKGMIRAYWYMRKQPETFDQCLQVERRLRLNPHRSTDAQDR